MNTVKEGIVKVAEAAGIQPEKMLLDLSKYVVDVALSKREAYIEKIRILSSHDVRGWQYNQIILKHFVKRNFTCYGSKRTVGISKVLSEIMYPRLARNIILTGKAGAGKSTALKWLFLHSHVKGYASLYLCAGMFDEYDTLTEVLERIGVIITKTDKCIVFFDGLDELKCIKGTNDEFELFINFFNEKSKYTSKSSHYKFVISTRPEHFSFHKMIIKKNSKKPLDNYFVFEIQMLTQKESMKVCRSIEQLSKFDEKENFSHFKDKWPSSSHNKEEISRAKYLTLLKKYLKETSPEESLLASPLLCRYAYPIIREWNSQDKSKINKIYSTQSTRIRFALESYIKWEFHDNCAYQTSGGEGGRLWTEYKQKVFAFLTQIAGIMGDKNAISKNLWESEKLAEGISVNAAFCALQEQDDKTLAFIHQSFLEFFLACYYAKATENRIKSNKSTRKIDFSTLTRLLESNHMFCIMYVEQLSCSSNKLINKICTFMLEEVANNSFENLAEFVCGNSWFTYRHGTPFTVEEYLKVFPNGCVKYNGILIRDAILRELRLTGILEVTDTKDLLHCKASEISKRIKIRGIKHAPMYWEGFKHIVRSLHVVQNNVFITIGGFWETSWSKEELFEILSRSEFQKFLSSDSLSVNEILTDEILQLASMLKHKRDYENRMLEDGMLRSWMENIIGFMGEDKDYWCLFEKSTLYIFQKISTNEKRLAILFNEGFCKNPNDYFSLYGSYRASTETKNELIEEGQFYKVENVIADFDANKYLSTEDNALRIFYSIHWKNIKLLSSTTDINQLSDAKRIARIVEMREILEMYKDADSILAKEPNEKMTLYLSDERLITLYAMGKGEAMVQLAENTMELCQKYRHNIGKDFREFLMADDTCFTGESLELVRRFAREYIWL